MMTLNDCRDRADRLRARITEIVHTKGELRVNVVLRSGKPQTWRAKR
jgi:hypothetical protein